MSQAKRITLKPGSMKGPVLAEDYSRSYSAVWTVVFDDTEGPGDNYNGINSRLTDQQSILLTSMETSPGGGLWPQIGQPHPADSGALCKSVSARETGDGGNTWEISADWSSKISSNASNNNQSGQGQAPTERVAEISWSSVTYEEAVWEDLDGKALKLSNGRPYNPGVSVQITNLLMTASVNKPSITKSAFDIVNTYNNAEFMGFGVGQAKCNSLSASYQFEDGVGFWKYTYVVEFKIYDPASENTPTWKDTYVLNVDTHYYKTIDGEKKLVSVRDDHDVLSGGSVLLNFQGFKQSDIDADPVAPGFQENTDDPTYKKYRVYGSSDFTTAIGTNAIDPYSDTSVQQ